MTNDSDTSFTRIRFHAQRGDGPDRRGDVTVEVSRSTDDTDAEGARREAERQFSKAVDYLESALTLDGDPPV